MPAIRPKMQIFQQGSRGVCKKAEGAEHSPAVLLYGARGSFHRFHAVVTGLHLQWVTCHQPFLRLTGEALTSFISMRNMAMGWDMCLLLTPSSSFTPSALPGERSP